jgi:hypothetical protein
MTDQAPAFDVIEGRPDFDTVYTRCPACDAVAACGSVDYVLTADGQMDLAHPVEISCVIAGHHYAVYTGAFLARDATRTCSRPSCAATFAVPAIADEVVCPHCRLHQPGPFIATDDHRTAYVDGVYAEHANTIRERLRRPRER